jgi:hypothetical protein
MKIENTETGKAALKRQLEISMIAKVLDSFGWRTGEMAQWQSALKDYQTAVGIRTASMGVMYSENDVICLMRAYGPILKNCLQKCFTIVPKGSDLATISAVTEKFCIEADQSVDQSYARKLYLKHGYIETEN